MISRVRMRTAPVRIARDGPWRITALTSEISYDEFVRVWRFPAPGKRIYDASNPLKAAGISNPTAPVTAAPQPSAAGFDVLARSSDRSRHAFHGQAPSISTSKEKLNTILISTISPRTPTLSRD
jgi:hypothetical protein